MSCHMPKCETCKRFTEAVDAVFAELDAMSPEEFKAELEKAKDGDIAQLLMHAGYGKEDPELTRLREENSRLRSGKVAYSSCDCDTKAMHQMHIFLQEAARARDRYRAALERIAEMGGSSPGDKKHLIAREALKGEL